jgi:hypothetical protein
MHLTKERVEELKALTEKATPGPWQTNYWDEQSRRNAEYIVAANPEVIRALCDLALQALIFQKLIAGIHYPEHWDTAAYPTLESALLEVGDFRCSECLNVAEEPRADYEVLPDGSCKF